MTPEHHDKVLAITSHLPHLIAYTIVGTVAIWRSRSRARSSNMPPAASPTSPASRLGPDHVA
jgi:hypothetical protein